MEIVIEIPEGCYKELKEARFPVQDANRLVAWIEDGTPLPKGHGRLIDADELIAKVEDLGACNGVSEGAIDRAPTIIEADEEAET